MKNPRGSKETTYSRMKSREAQAEKDWMGASKPSLRGPAKPEDAPAYKKYTTASKKRAQAGAAMSREKRK